MSYNTGVCRARYKIISGLNHDISYLKSSISRARIHSCAADTICAHAVNYQLGDPWLWRTRIGC